MAPHWVILPMLVLCWALGMVLVWTRESTPARFKVAMTLLSLGFVIWLLRLAFA
ncbi:MAG: hypothetical protein R2734_04850 [Nocardioides sp.]